MLTYFIMNTVFIIICYILLGLKIKWSINFLKLLGVLLLMTAVFDAMIIHFGVVAYSPDKLLRAYLGIVPVEDFMYAIFAAILLPSMWNKFDKVSELEQEEKNAKS